MRVVAYLLEYAWTGTVGSAEVRAYLRSMGSPGASAYSANAPHPYMQKADTLDLAIVQEGEIVLALDTQEVKLGNGDFVVLRGANHAWSNRSTRPAVLAIASHDGKW